MLRAFLLLFCCFKELNVPRPFLQNTRYRAVPAKPSGHRSPRMRSRFQPGNFTEDPCQRPASLTRAIVTRHLPQRLLTSIKGCLRETMSLLLGTTTVLRGWNPGAATFPWFSRGQKGHRGLHSAPSRTNPHAHRKGGPEGWQRR